MSHLFIAETMNKFGCFRAFLVMALLHICSLTFAQYEGLLNKPYNQKLQAIHDFYNRIIVDEPDSAHAYTYIDQFRKAARIAGDDESVLEADLAEALFDFRRLEHSLAKMYRMEQIGKEKRILHIACRAAYVIAQDRWENQSYEQAFRSYATLDSLLQQVDVAGFPNKITYLNDIGRAHYEFGDYQRAVPYFREATQHGVHPFFENAWKHAMNNLGLVYQKLDRLSLSDSCFRQIFTHNDTDSEVWAGIAAGNLGYNQYLLGNDAVAIPLLQKDINIALKYGDFGLASGSATPMADILTRRGELPAAKRYLDSAYAYIYRSGQTDRLRRLFPVMSKWHAASGKAADAARYMDSTMVANEQYYAKFSGLKMLRASQEQMASRREADLQRLQAEGQRQVNQRNLILGGLVFCVLIGVFWVYKQRKANELALKDRDLRLLEAGSELQDARIQLDDFARTIAEKNRLLAAYAKTEQTAETRELVEQLSKQVVLTDDDWSRFSTLFGKVYPGFQYQLKTRYPTLTPAEIRCLSMEKLRFSNKEMAALQGISTSTVLATKHRIRKKLDIGSHTEIIELIQSI